MSSRVPSHHAPGAMHEPRSGGARYPGRSLVATPLEGLSKIEALVCDTLATTERHREAVERAILSASPSGGSTNARGGAVDLLSDPAPARVVSEAVAQARSGRRVAVILHADELIHALAPIAEASRLPRACIVVHVFAHAHEGGALRSGRDELAPALDIGAGLVVSSGLQEALDLTLAVRRAAEDCETPFIHIVDAPPMAVEISMLEGALVDAYLGAGPQLEPGSTAAESTRAAAKRDERSYAARAPFALQSAMRALGDWTGRSLHPIERVHTLDADDIIVAVGGAVAATLPVVAELRQKGRRIGVVGVRSLRPFFAAELVKAVARAHAIVVLEPLDIALAPAGPLATALKAAFADALTWTPGFPGVGKIPPIVSATVATLETAMGPEEVHAALAEIEDGEQARRVIVFGTSSDDTRPRPPTVRPGPA